MDEKNKSTLFRESSLARISSPEDLNDYVRVANPGVWIVLIAIVILLAGFIVWGCFADLNSMVDGVIVSDEGITTCFISEEYISNGSVVPGMTVSTDDNEYIITQIDGQAVEASEVLSEYTIHLGGFAEGEWVHALSLDSEAPEGAEPAKVIVDSVHPISFILNN